MGWSRQQILNCLETGECINQTRKNKTPLIWAIKNEEHEIAQELLRQGANVDIPHRSGQTPLSMAVEIEDLELVELLLQYHPDLNKPDNGGETPITLAVWNGDLEMVKLLDGADVNVRNSEKKTPLKMAIQNNNYRMVKQLIQMGANMTMHDVFLDIKDLRTLKLFIKNDWDVNQSNKYYETLLHLLIHEYSDDPTDVFYRMIEHLIEHGANMLAQDDDRQTPFSMANDYEMADVVHLMIEYGVEFTLYDLSDEVMCELDMNWVNDLLKVRFQQRNLMLMVKCLQVKNVKYQDCVSPLLNRKIKQDMLFYYRLAQMSDHQIREITRYL